MLFRSVFSAGLFLILSGTALAQTDRFERIGDWASQGRFQEAAGELRRIVEKAEPGWQPSPTEKKLLGRAIKVARPALRGTNGKAARQVLCRSRAYFSEELPGIGEPIRSLGAGRPEVISRVGARRTGLARRVDLQGTVLLEVVIDPEGCVRSPRVLKGLPFGLNEVATNAVRRWTFEPARLRGRPVAVYYVIPVSFSLRN